MTNIYLHPSLTRPSNNGALHKLQTHCNGLFATADSSAYLVLYRKA